VALLVVFRLLLPVIVLHFANKSLANVKGYYGHIEDIDMSLYRGAYQVKNMYLNKRDSNTGKQTDFFKVAEIDLSVEWKALLHGSLAGQLLVDKPSLIFTKDKTELGDIKKDTNDFRKIVKNLMPLKINRFEINEGSLHYIDKSSKPPVDLSMKQIHVLATNLNNSFDSSKQLPSTVYARATAYDGTVTMNMKLDALARSPTFDLNAEIKNVNLVKLNDFMKAYGNFDVNKGNFGLFAELAAKENKFKGYVKPVIKDLDVVGKEDKKDNFFHKLWESAVGAVGVIFRNQKKDQIATKLPLEGSFNNPQTNTWEAVWEVLRNAFIQALVPSVDNQISLASVDKNVKVEKKSLLQRIFSPGKKDNKKGKDKKGQPEKKASPERKQGKEIGIFYGCLPSPLPGGTHQ
jgi:hypothetical protein